MDVGLRAIKLIDPSLAAIHSWDISSYPSGLSFDRDETLPLIDLVSIGDPKFDKPALIFSSLIAKVACVLHQAEHEIFPPFVLYGEITASEVEAFEKELERVVKLDHKVTTDLFNAKHKFQNASNISTFLPHIIKTAQFLSTCYSLLKQLIQQLAVLYRADSVLYKNVFSAISLNPVFLAISRLLAIFIILDEIIKSGNENILPAWKSHLNIILDIIEAQKASNDPENSENPEHATSGAPAPDIPNTHVQDLARLESLIGNLNDAIFSGKIYQNATRQIFDQANVPYPTDEDIAKAKIAIEKYDTEMNNYQQWKSTVGDNPPPPDSVLASDSSNIPQLPKGPRPSLPPPGQPEVVVFRNQVFLESLLSYIQHSFYSFSNPSGISSDISTISQFPIPLNKLFKNDPSFPISHPTTPTAQMCVSSCFASIEQKLKIPSLHKEYSCLENLRTDFIGIYGLYGLYFSITHNVGDETTFELAWKTHYALPLVHTVGSCCWSPGEFIHNVFERYIGSLQPAQINQYNSSAKDARISFMGTLGLTIPVIVNGLGVELSAWVSRFDGVSTFKRKILTDPDDNFAPSGISKDTIIKTVQRDGELLLQGIILVTRINRVLRDIIFLHVATKTAMTKSNTRLVGRLVEYLSIFHATWINHTVFIILTAKHYLLYLAQKSIRLLCRILGHITDNKILASTGNYSEAFDINTIDSSAPLSHTFVCNALMQAIRILTNHGTHTTQRRLVLAYLISFGNVSTSSSAGQKVVSSKVKTKQISEIMEVMQTHMAITNIIADADIIVKRAVNCSFLFNCRDLFPFWVESIISTPLEASRLIYLTRAMETVYHYLANARHHDWQILSASFSGEVAQLLKETVVDHLCSAVEADLRLSTHSHLDVAERNIVTGVTSSGAGGNTLKDYIKFILLPPIQIGDQVIDIKRQLEYYLDTTFYNLTTLALYNWKTYAQMRNLAHQKYGLRLINPYLPGHSSHNHRDVVQIMRSIHTFATSNVYNLNTQIFLQKEDPGKHLDSIRIVDMANSIKAHGTGIMNTAVNVTYQYLRQQFVLVSRFLFDSHIKSLLIKQSRNFNRERDALENMYPVENANTFLQQMKQLTARETRGRRNAKTQIVSYLDQFRNLVTEIGNALGYIRMVRSGGLNYVSTAVQFVPDLEETDYEQLSQGLNKSTQQSSSHLDRVLGNLLTKFGEGTQYFKLLVQVFSTLRSGGSNSHLMLFPFIIPPLTLSYVDHMIRHKQKLGKRNNLNPLFTDDGFSLGIAYIVCVLGVDSVFTSLHWFDSVVHYYTNKLKTISETVTAKGHGNLLKNNTGLGLGSGSGSQSGAPGTGADTETKKKTGTLGRFFSRGSSTSKKSSSDTPTDPTIQPLLLEHRKYKTYLAEFKSLSYTMSSARIFFRDLATADTPPSGKGNEQGATTTSGSGSGTGSSPNSQTSELPPAPDYLPPPPTDDSFLPPPPDNLPPPPSFSSDGSMSDSGFFDDSF